MIARVLQRMNRREQVTGRIGVAGGVFAGQLVFVELAFAHHWRFASRSRETKTNTQ